MKQDSQPLAVDTFDGRIHVEWDPQAAVTPLGQLPFFIEFLKVAELFDPWVEQSPLAYSSPNAPEKRDILGTMLLSILAGHKRYAHITSMRCDQVNAELLGMKKVASEDSVRRAFTGVDEHACAQWQQNHLRRCWEPLLHKPWILDLDATVKLLYGHQESAAVGYNPRKPGRPSHVLHSYLIANLRLVLDVEVQAGNRSAGSHGLAGLERLLDSFPRAAQPFCIRGDISYGNETMLSVAEQRSVDYLFKLRQTRGVQTLIERLCWQHSWDDAGLGWQGTESSLQLQGWTKKRRVVVLRRRVKDIIALEQKNPRGQLALGFVQAPEGVITYEYAVLVTSLSHDVVAIAQLYRDRADAENVFDELKNQWGWAGFTTKDVHRCQVMARTTALVYNWWSLFARLAIPKRHAEALTSRPLLLHAVGKQTRHAGQKRLTLTSSHRDTKTIQKVLARLSAFFKTLKATAEQLSWAERWSMILSRALVVFLGGKPLGIPQKFLPLPT
jgi:hypothetical protein